MSDSVLRLGTRGSLLARMQSEIVADALRKLHPHLQVELIIFKTSGDKILDRPLWDACGKGLFTKELEEALLADAIDLAVHSCKDVPVTMPLVDQSELIIAAMPTRQDARDVLVSTKAKRLRDLPPHAKVGTSSLRRKCQLLSIRSDFQIESVRGNIDTRIRKLREGQYDGLILAMAGLVRSQLFDERDMTPISLDEMLPAAGQGALAIQCRKNDDRVKELLRPLNDPITQGCVTMERELVEVLQGDCMSPIAALANVEDRRIKLRAAVGMRGGELPVVRAIGESVNEVVQKLFEQNPALKGPA
ncbi:MAG TPA: hydroxymethylbilane synthase [Tepidisphaeraceae bacterium]|nr:hydroxymethylbilane synthase [Tepidisphaeraceae bacterium]